MVILFLTWEPLYINTVQDSECPPFIHNIWPFPQPSLHNLLIYTFGYDIFMYS